MRRDVLKLDSADASSTGFPLGGLTLTNKPIRTHRTCLKDRPGKNRPAVIVPFVMFRNECKQMGVQSKCAPGYTACWDVMLNR